MKSMVDVSHEFLKPVLHKQAICVDATLGQGKDTDFFLSQNVHKVYGFEIQRDVFESTKERLDDQRTCFYNVGHEHMETSVYKGYKQDKIEMRGDRAEMSDLPLYLNTVAGGLDRRDQTIGGFSFIVKIYAVPVVEIIG